MAITKMYWAFISNLIAFRQNRQSVAKKNNSFFFCFKRYDSIK